LNQPVVISPKKLIEVALPLDAINVACAREKSIRHGHPSTLHLWWARRPLAAARAVIFSQLVHDPEDLWRCQNPGVEPNPQVKGHWTKARARLFTIIEELVKWESTTNEEVLNKARDEIRKSWLETCELNKDHPQASELFSPEKIPGLHDPFAGGGTIPLEAQRLGLEAYASDLNPVPVLINKAMIEIPPRFAGRAPINPQLQTQSSLLPCEWKKTAGLAEDIRYYGQWIRDEACKRIGRLYPQVEITEQMLGQRPDLAPYKGEKLTVIAWLWARSVKSPNPAFSHVDVPLTSTFILCSKPGREVYVQPIVSGGNYRIEVKMGKPPAEAKTGTKSSRGANFRCIVSGTAIDPDYVRSEAVAGRMSETLIAIVAEGNGRIYLSPSTDQMEVAALANTFTCNAADLHVPIANDPRPMTCLLYGMTHFDHLFTKRQLTALVTLSDLVIEARTKIELDAVAAGLKDDGIQYVADGTGALAYAEAISVYLGFALDKVADRGSTLGRWDPSPTQSGIINTFSRQALPITWDFAEANPLGDASGNFRSAVELVAKSLSSTPANFAGYATQANATTQTLSRMKFVSTDPPYYDNIGYADLSDFFYVWMRRILRQVFPSQMATIVVPKTEELIVAAYRHKDKKAAETFFLEGMTLAMRNVAEQAHPSAPITIYYAFKQSDTAADGTNNTGWETFLEAIYRANLSVTGTWPMRTELGNRMRGTDSNALASSVILVCRPRKSATSVVSRRQFVRELNATLPLALDAMTRESEGLHSPVAPVDLSQAIIGPGMGVFSKFSAVLEADGSAMTVRTALQLINRFLAEDDFDADTQFCLHWFDQYHWDSGKFGEADVLSRAKGTSVEGVKQAGIIASASGSVRLLKWSEYPTDWNPASDSRLPVWETLHQLIRVFQTEGESGAGTILSAVQSQSEAARQLAYRLYTLCERANLAEDARAYNDLITSWTGIESAAAKAPAATQRTLFND